MRADATAVNMPAYDDALERAADRPAFSNGFEGDAWMENWCYRCVHEANPDETGACPLLTIAMAGKTPAEWTEQDRGDLGNQYLCTKFEAVLE